MRKFTFVFIAVLMALILTGCPEPDSGSDSDDYYIVYNGNGNTSGTAPTDSAVYKEGDVITVLDNTDLVKTGVKFSGWNTSPDGTGTDQTVGSAFILSNANVLLYAKWVDYAVGDTGPAGGLIFYVDEADAFSWDYLEAAPSDQNGGSGIVWSNITDQLSLEDTTIGSGQANTTAIIGQAGCNDGAAYLCNVLEITNGGVDYIDWFLPSKDELNLMYTNLYLQSLGGLSDYYYWSSSNSVGVATAAWAQYFWDGSWGGKGKVATFNVRAIRAF